MMTAISHVKPTTLHLDLDTSSPGHSMLSQVLPTDSEL